LGGGGTHREASPDDHHGWEEDSGFDVSESEVGWDLATILHQYSFQGYWQSFPPLTQYNQQ